MQLSLFFKKKPKNQMTKIKLFFFSLKKLSITSLFKAKLFFVFTLKMNTIRRMFFHRNLPKEKEGTSDTVAVPEPQKSPSLPLFQSQDGSDAVQPSVLKRVLFYLQNNWRSVCTVLLGAFIVVILILYFIPGSGVKSAIDGMLDKLGSVNPVLGVSLTIVMYTVCISLMLPATPLNIASGYMFAFPTAFLTSTVGISLGAVIAFLLGRTLMRPWAEEKMRSSETMMITVQAIKEKAALLIFLLRLSPIMPFPLLSYIMGVVPDLSFWTYTIFTILGVLPGLFTHDHTLRLILLSFLIATAMFSYLGSSFKKKRKSNTFDASSALCLFSSSKP